MTSGSIPNKKVVPMWRIHDWLYTDKAAAEEVEDGKEVVQPVFVAVDEDFELTPERDDPSTYGASYSFDFFGSWVFTDELEAHRQVKQFNEEEM
jgi:hypothetical protein